MPLEDVIGIDKCPKKSEKILVSSSFVDFTYLLIGGKKSQISVFFRGFGIKGNRQKYQIEIPLFIMLHLKDMMAILLTI
jgi:hypothetical protein